MASGTSSTPACSSLGSSQYCSGQNSDCFCEEHPSQHEACDDCDASLHCYSHYCFGASSYAAAIQRRDSTVCSKVLLQTNYFHIQLGNHANAHLRGQAKDRIRYQMEVSKAAEGKSAGCLHRSIKVRLDLLPSEWGMVRKSEIHNAQGSELQPQGKREVA